MITIRIPIPRDLKSDFSESLDLPSLENPAEPPMLSIKCFLVHDGRTYPTSVAPDGIEYEAFFDGWRFAAFRPENIGQQIAKYLKERPWPKNLPTS